MSPQQQRWDTLTVKDAAKYFNRSERTIIEWCRNGTLVAADCRLIRLRPGNWLILVPQQ